MKNKMSSTSVYSAADLNEMLENIDTKYKEVSGKINDLSQKIAIQKVEIISSKDIISTYDRIYRGISYVEYPFVPIGLYNLTMDDVNKFSSTSTIQYLAINSAGESPDLINFSVLDTGDGMQAIVRKYKDRSGFRAILYTNQMQDTHITITANLDFRYNFLNFEISKHLKKSIMIGTSLFTENIIILPSPVEEKQITIRVEVPEVLFIPNTSSTFSQKYMAIIDIPTLVISNIITEDEYTIILKVPKYPDDTLLDSIVINDGLNFSNEFYSNILIDLAASEEDVENKNFFRTISIKGFGKLTLPLLEYRGSEFMFFRLYIKDDRKPIILQNIKMVFKLRN